LKILHTGDWHLGQRLGRIDRASDLRRAVVQVFDHCDRQRVDLLLIAGDLFDTVCRPDDVRAAVAHLEEAARPFLAGGGTILATTGNHDGETFCATLQHTLALADRDPRREIGDRLAPGRFHLFTRPALHRLADRDGREVQFVLMPYPQAARYLDDAANVYHGGAEAKNRRLLDAFTAALVGLRNHDRYDPALPSVLVAHLHLRGARLPGGHEVTERDDVVCPPENLGEGWAYVALGHVHRPQALGGRSHVRYCGSIERLDLDERDDLKSVVLVEIGPDGRLGEPVVLPIESTPFLDVVVSDPAADLPALEAAHGGAIGALVRCRVAYTPGADDPDDIHRRIDALFPRCYSRRVDPAITDAPTGPAATASVAVGGRAVRQVVLDYLNAQLDGQPIAAAVLAEAERLLDEVAP